MLAKSPKPRLGALDRHIATAEAIALLFKPHIEVVLHDLATSTIAHIVNPYSRRAVGDSSLGDAAPVENFDQSVIGPYRKVNPDGRNLRSITAVLRDDDGAPVGLMCINFDVSLLETIGDQIGALAFLPGSLEPHAPLFHDNWRQAIERVFTAAENECGMTLKAFDKAQRIALLERLEAGGLLGIRNAPVMVAERLGVSKAALYTYIKHFRPSKTAAG